MTTFLLFTGKMTA